MGDEYIVAITQGDMRNNGLPMDLFQRFSESARQSERLSANERERCSDHIAVYCGSHSHPDNSDLFGGEQP